MRTIFFSTGHIKTDLKGQLKNQLCLLQEKSNSNWTKTVFSSMSDKGNAKLKFL